MATARDNQARKQIFIPATQPETELCLRVAAYCRVSTDSEDQLNSFAAQNEHYVEMINAHERWEMVDIYADEGISGRSAKNRDDFQRLLNDCRKGKIDKVLVKSISRFARNTAECLAAIRELKAMGISIFFEDHNIDTSMVSSEMLTAVLAACAQAESESISRNMRWSYQKRMESGKFITCKAPMGYRLVERQLVVHEEEAEIIRDVFRMFLSGWNTEEIAKELTDRGVKTREGLDSWKAYTIKRILVNEKYIGDALLQKTFVQDCISKKVVKNTGQLPMYLVRNNHPAIVSREVYQAVQAELTRHSASESHSQKTSSTGRSCYTSKYALSERLVCGECGTLYRRCTWSIRGQKKIVWRCVSRLEYGKKYCKESPTMEETVLQNAIMAAINSVVSPKDELAEQIADAMQQEMIKMPGSAMILGEVKRRLEEREAEFTQLLTAVAKQGIDAYKERVSALSTEMDELEKQQEELASQLRTNSRANLRLHRAVHAM